MEHLASHLERDRRLIRRYEIRTPLRIRVCKSNGPEHKAESLNLSEYGVYFATNSLLQEGETVEVVLRMPEEVIGQEADEWKCTGRVVRVERIESAQGELGIGVRFDCYEVARTEQRQLAKNAKLHERVTPAKAS
jgi:PilZ domain-containing protein